MPTKKTVAIFGGSFNPPHVAHVLAAGLILSTERVDEILVVPAFCHPFAKKLAPFEDRVRMSELAMGWLPGVHVSRIEEELGGESRTLRTLEALAVKNQDWKLRLILGADLLNESERWFRFEAIRALAPPLVVGRFGVERPGLPVPLLPAISSTEIRAMVAAKKWDELSPIVPYSVLDHIRKHRLYLDPD